MAKLQELKILIDCDDNGYLLQIFTKHMHAGPANCLSRDEIQKNNHQGFRPGKAQAEWIELDRGARGNL